MAITAVSGCLGPPPLPPGKRFLQRSSRKSSSTYRSFRDPAVESWWPSGGDGPPDAHRPCVLPAVLPARGLPRSRSEGNLNLRPGEARECQPTPLDRCIRAIYGSWRNLLQLGGMSRPSKAVTQAKKVAPPAVPDVFRHSGSSFGSAGYASSEDGCFLPTAGGGAAGPGPGPGPGNGNGVGAPDDASYGMPSGKSPGPVFTHPGFAFPPIVGKYAHAEDQGIDMTQSPGRDSPGSSGSGSGSRHSTASLDSGRASGYHLGPRGPGALASSPRCSISSLGSHPDRPADLDVVHAWLSELQFEEYFPLFASAGYDLATITRMTPEDLTAIGIKKPNHRKRLKAEIDNLNIGDGLPEHVPGSLEEWLRLLRLEEYLGALHQQGMRSVEDVTTLTWEDLEDIGIVRLGHQKKLLLAIKRVKDIRAGKRIQPLDLARLPPHPGHTQVTATTGQFKSLPREFDNKYQLTYGLESSPHLPKRCPPSPPRRQSSRDVGPGTPGPGDVVIDCSGPVPTASCEEHLRHHHHHLHHHHRHPPPHHHPQGQSPGSAPSTPPQMSRPPSSMSRSWGSVSVNVNEEHELIASLALQHRNGSDASFKSSSSAESDSLPFANENAGTIKQRTARGPEYSSSPGNMGGQREGLGAGGEPADVLNDIGNMLANLTDELDAMLEEEKRQGLNP
ncbi:caskin-1 isoform X3 [Orussus abietinus]|uniref:caskin-1 isoform X3 n=1 Tax=Orussus abietinus TaxID=222816 RepID=UPI0006268420|nr:caskin-1 isoform X3 [Orussus abietinus]